MNRLLHLFFGIFLIIFSFRAAGQAAQPPTLVIKYDLKNPVFPEVPFDKPFAILVEGVQASEIERIHAYETRYSNGKLSQIETSYKDQNGDLQSAEIMDFEPIKDPKSKELLIHFPPIKPNKTFTVHLQKKLSPECRALLLKYNGEIMLEADQPADFDNVINCVEDKATGYSYFGINRLDKYYINTYRSFFDQKLKNFYDLLADENNYTLNKKLSLKNIRALDSTSTHFVQDYADCKFLYEVVAGDQLKDVLLGKGSIYNAYSLNAEDKADTYDFIKRLGYLQANLKILDEALQRCTRVLSRGVDQVKIGDDMIQLADVRKELLEFRDALYKNLHLFETYLKAINKAIDGDDRFRQSISLGAGTLSMTIKAAGGNILFLDAGLTNIFAKNLNDEMTFLPKLYFGVSIYFRPIDKNTRSSSFAWERQLRPKINQGCRTINGNEECGPDYGVVSNYSLWQHLSLNVGITLGGMPDKDFDNFYNSNSLLIGPAFRFARAFKVGTGLSLLRRSSKNPLISDKEIIPGAYVSLSVDIDFIQPISNVISILFK